MRFARSYFLVGLRQAILPNLAVVLMTAALLCPSGAIAQATLPALTATPGANGAQTYSLSVQTLLMLTSLSFLPAALLMMTGFTRIIIVLGLLRRALGTAMSPPNHVLIGLALFLTFYTMSPVFDKIYTEAYKPLSAGAIAFETAVERGAVPLHSFMLRQTRENDLALFANMANLPAIEEPSKVPMKILVPAFITSELKTAFQIGFTIFIPFLIIDLVVASVLMALGMMMVPPITVSLPFKLMLFVLADGWNLLLGSLARSFYQ
jgi:flagellar biosynthetic protein FliP